MSTAATHTSNEKRRYKTTKTPTIARSIRLRESPRNADSVIPPGRSCSCRASARREMGVELKTAVVWDRFFGEDIRVRGDLRRADGDLCVAGTGFG